MTLWKRSSLSWGHTLRPELVLSLLLLGQQEEETTGGSHAGDNLPTKSKNIEGSILVFCRLLI